MKQKFSVSGMTCAACSAHVEKAVNKLEGVHSAEVSLMTNSMRVVYDESLLNNSEIQKAVEAAGYGAQATGEEGKTQAAAVSSYDLAREETMAIKRRFIWSLVFMLPLMYISMGHMGWWPIPAFFHGPQNAIAFAFTQLLLTLPIVIINKNYYINGFRSLFHLAPNMDSLIAIGSSAAFIYGIYAIYAIGHYLGRGDMDAVSAFSMNLYFESAAMILTLITMGKFLEARSKGSTSKALEKLMDLSPKTAIRLRNGVEEVIPADQLVQGDEVVVKPGQLIPADGVVIRGTSAVDEAALTGESLPREVHEGETVMAASLNKTGSFVMRAEKVSKDTVLWQIVQLMEEAASSKAPIAKLADKVSGIFVPIVIVIAVVTAVVWLALGMEVAKALSFAISVLVISCPCALGLATPVAIMVGTGKGAENGILIKSGEALETAQRITAVVLDKTGTITQGHPKVTDVLPVAGADETALLRLAAALEQPSEHPLAEAILNHAKQRGVEVAPVQDFGAQPGKGIQAKLDGKMAYAGNLAWMQACGIDMGATWEHTLDSLAQEGKTPLCFAQGQRFLGIIAVADTVKQSSEEAIRLFKERGIKTVMLTGDNQRTAAAIARQVGIDEVHAQVLPNEKEEHIRALQAQGYRVAMVGDGINDAPALARADVGLAIGAGTDVAIESADIVLMKSDIRDVVTALDLSRATLRNIKQNLFWAFFYNALGIPLAAGVFYGVLGWQLSPMIGAAAMSLSSFFVVMNALRLRFFKPAGTYDEAGPSTDVLPEGSQAASPGLDIESTEKGEHEMKKIVKIEGMTCMNCVKHVSKALNALEGVQAEVNLEEKQAVLTLDHDIANDLLKDAVEEAGYEVVGIE